MASDETCGDPRANKLEQRVRGSIVIGMLLSLTVSTFKNIFSGVGDVTNHTFLGTIFSVRLLLVSLSLLHSFPNSLWSQVTSPDRCVGCITQVANRSAFWCSSILTKQSIAALIIVQQLKTALLVCLSLGERLAGRSSVGSPVGWLVEQFCRLPFVHLFTGLHRWVLFFVCFVSCLRGIVACFG